MNSMKAIWPYFIASLLFAWLSDLRSYYRIENGVLVWIRKDRLFFFLSAITMSLFIGLRLWCNDTGTYLDIYTYLTPESGSVFKLTSWSLGSNPGFLITNNILKHLHVSKQNYLMVFSFFTNITYLWFLKKYSRNYLLSVFLIWTMGTYLFTAAAIKQTTATALGLIGVDAYLENKKRKFAALILLGMTFHPYLIVFFLTSYVSFQPWSEKTGRFSLICVVIGVGLQLLSRIIIGFTSLIGATFTENDLSGEGVNIFRLLVAWAPIIMSFFVRKEIKANKSWDNYILFNLSMMNALLMFVALFGTANYFARLANYFQIFQAISIPWLLGFLPRRGKGTYSFVIISCYMLYFVVANTIMTPFDRYFAKMSLWNYLQTLF